MKRALLATLLVTSLGMLTATAQEVSAPGVVIERSLWIKPGRVQQAIALLKRTELARLDALRQQGSVLWYRTTLPVLANGHDHWDYRITVAWKDADAAAANVDAFTPPAPGKAGSSAGVEQALLLELVTDHRDVWVRETRAGGG